jgi:hypothetical protein
MSLERRTFLGYMAAAASTAAVGTLVGCEEDGQARRRFRRSPDEWGEVRRRFPVDPEYIHLAGLLIATRLTPGLLNDPAEIDATLAVIDDL